LRDRLPELRAAGARVAVIGNGTAAFAQAFREDLALPDDLALLVDPELRSYRAAGMRRGRSELFSPRLATNALRALRGGFRPGAVQGDPFQLGGLLVVRTDGALAYRHISREAGDRADLGAVLGALAADAPAVREGHGRSRLAPFAAALSRVLDPTVVLSFDRSGFARHALAFEPSDLDRDLTDRRALVTGANSGIGFETALALADLGAEVVLACRNEERGLAARDAIRERSGNARVSLERLDVSSLADVRTVAARLAGGRLDVLVHNAGVLPDARSETAEGLETTFATHVAGPHLLTQLLLPALERADDARVVWVSSGGMYTRKLDLRDPQWKARRYDGVLAYAETKRMQVALAADWARRMGKSGPRVVSMHPGWADTPAVASSLPRFRRVTERILRTPAEGADTVVWLAAAPREKIETGGFYFDRQRRSTHVLPWTRESASERAALWKLVEKAVAAPAQRIARAR
jgi:dehydrogenase/reductase SDR family protein 12